MFRKLSLKPFFTFKKKFRQPKIEVPEDYIITQENTRPYLNITEQELINKSQIWNEDFEKGLNHDEIPIPISPNLGPISIKSPVFQYTYNWCSCGMSKKQPFCDGSHKGTQFKPIPVQIHEKVREINLCGCKWSSTKPFCDGNTCIELKNQQND